MNTEQVLALIEAGVTPDQIRVIEQTLETKAPEPEPENVTAGSPATGADPETEGQLTLPDQEQPSTTSTNKKPDGFEARIDSMLAEVNNTLTKMQQANMRSNNPDFQMETTEDILARVINPKTKEVIE